VDQTDYASMQQCAVSCADGPTLDGIDVSYWQGNINWDSVAQTNMAFAFIRTGDGYFEDPQFERNWSEARRVGLLRGAYHYFRPNKDIDEQADIMISKLGTLQAGDLPPVIDLEDESMYGSYSRATVIAKIHQFMDRVEAGTGRRVMIYTGYYWWNDIIGNDGGAFADNPLWIAQYGPTCPKIPDNWPRWTFFQTASTGRVSGISGNVDLDLFNGTMADLESLAEGGNPGGDPGQQPDDGTLEGVVFVDQGQGTSDMSWRLPGATVQVSNGSSTTAGAGDAFWSFQLAPGEYTVTASLDGYQTASRTCALNPGGESWCSVGLVPNGDPGQDPGGDPGQDPGGDPGQDPGGDPGQDPGGDPGDSPCSDSGGGQGKIYGWVLYAANVEDPAIEGATISITMENLPGECSVTTDSDGYFEKMVRPGTITLQATKPGYVVSGNECVVTEGGETECNIVIPEKDVPNQDDPQEDPPVYGCSTAGHAPAPVLLSVLLLLCCAIRRKP